MEGFRRRSRSIVMVLNKIAEAGDWERILGPQLHLSVLLRAKPDRRVWHGLNNRG